MKILGILILCSFCEVFGWGRGDLEKFGPFQLALHSVKCDHDRLLDLDVNGVDVYFYDFTKNELKSFPITEAAKGILALKDLNITKKLIVFVPGFKSQINKKTEDRVRDTFRNLPNSYLIILDHSMYTNNREGNKKSYERSVKYVHYIGKALAGMLTELTNGGFSPKQIHAIGHSLGGQMLGHTGEAYHNNTGMKLSRITALDPAGPCFSNSLIQEQVRSGVAEYVEVYHCNAGGLGTTSVLGDIDFFANRKGEAQPDCKTPLIPGVFDSSKAATCNHKACVLLYTATVNNPEWFVARRCEAYRSFRNGSCSINDSTIAGFWNPGTAKGVYYFSTEGYDIK